MPFGKEALVLYAGTESVAERFAADREHRDDIVVACADHLADMEPDQWIAALIGRRPP